MSRNKALVCCCAMLLVSALTYADSPRYCQLTILHTNDTHGNLLPFKTPAESMPELAAYAKDGVIDLGGIARRATLAKQLSKRFGDTWLLDAGDYTDGTAFSIEFGGKADLAAMAAAGYSIECMGNHEMKSLNEWKSLVDATKFSLVDANIIMRSTKQPALTPYVIKQTGDVKVAVFGLMTTDARTYPLSDDADFNDPIDTAKALVPELRKQADIVICLSHCGYDVDQKIAQNVDGIDLIVGGHSHTRLSVPTAVVKGDISEIGKCNRTFIVQTGQWGQELGCEELKLRKNADGWAMMSVSGKLIPVTSEIAPDAAVDKIVNASWGKLRSHYVSQLGVATGEFYPRGNDEEPYYMVADLTRQLLKSDVHIENMGGVRAYLCRGAISRYDLARLLPWDNQLVMIDMTGEQLAKIIMSQQPAPSGLRYRISEGKLQDISVNGVPLDVNRVYHVSTNSYFGGIICKELGVSSKVVAKDARESLAQAIINSKTISPSYDGRRIVENKE